MKACAFVQKLYCCLLLHNLRLVTASSCSHLRCPRPPGGRCSVCRRGPACPASASPPDSPDPSHSRTRRARRAATRSSRRGAGRGRGEAARSLCAGCRAGRGRRRPTCRGHTASPASSPGPAAARARPAPPPPGRASGAGRGRRASGTCGTWRGGLNLRIQVSLGTVVHCWTGDSLGTSLVINLQVFRGLRSQDSSGTSTTLVMTWS